jgi:integrase/recombinase XerD
MLEQYYVRPVTADRTRASWIGAAIEQYVGWLAERQYSSRTVLRRIPLLVAFGEFAKTQGATEVAQLADHVEPFVEAWVSQHARHTRVARKRNKIGACVRNPIRQMLRLAIPGYIGRGRPHRPANPFEAQAPRFIAYLTEEKGLRPRTLYQYRFHLHQFAAYLVRIGLKDITHVSPNVLSGFVAEYGPRVAWSTHPPQCLWHFAGSSSLPLPRGGVGPGPQLPC